MTNKEKVTGMKMITDHRESGCRFCKCGSLWIQWWKNTSDENVVHVVTCDFPCKISKNFTLLWRQGWRQLLRPTAQWCPAADRPSPGTAPADGGTGSVNLAFLPEQNGAAEKSANGTQPTHGWRRAGPLGRCGSADWQGGVVGDRLSRMAAISCPSWQAFPGPSSLEVSVRLVGKWRTTLLTFPIIYGICTSFYRISSFTARMH